ncbi:hypothetical protein, partial [Escherichia coli]|uniref:hypothetical protein n=1 Tax=Escherichia coli TaxID=562 RepID=UPI0028A49290
CKDCFNPISSMIFVLSLITPPLLLRFLLRTKLPLRIKKRNKKGGREWFVHDVQCAEGISGGCFSVGWMELRG